MGVSGTRRVPCRYCHGFGDRELVPHEIETMVAVAAAGSHDTGNWVATDVIIAILNRGHAGSKKLSVQALNNRLVALERLGQLESRPDSTNARRKKWRVI